MIKNKEERNENNRLKQAQKQIYIKTEKQYKRKVFISYK